MGNFWIELNLGNFQFQITCMQGRRVSQRDLRGSAGAAQRDKERKTPKGAAQRRKKTTKQVQPNGANKPATGAAQRRQKKQNRCSPTATKNEKPKKVQPNGDKKKAKQVQPNGANKQATGAAQRRQNGANNHACRVSVQTLRLYFNALSFAVRSPCLVCQRLMSKSYRQSLTQQTRS